MSRGQRLALTIAVAALALGGLYWVFSSLLAEREESLALADRFHLEIPLHGRDVRTRSFDTGIEDFPIFKAVHGQTLTLTIRSERSGSVHIHGYEENVDLDPGREVTLTFEAKEAGLFPIHLHGDHEVMEHLATFEIRPE